jgi:hypothetical protein
VDYSIRIVNNILEGDRLHIDEDRAMRFASAMASHKWPVDSSGTRTGVKPVHDWTSHFADAFRYGMSVLVGHGPRKAPGFAEEPKAGDDPRTYGFIHKQLDAAEAEDFWLGSDPEPHITFDPGLIRPRS